MGTAHSVNKASTSFRVLFESWISAIQDGRQQDAIRYMRDVAYALDRVATGGETTVTTVTNFISSSGSGTSYSGGGSGDGGTISVQAGSDRPICKLASGQDGIYGAAIHVDSDGRAVLASDNESVGNGDAYCCIGILQDPVGNWQSGYFYYLCGASQKVKALVQHPLTGTNGTLCLSTTAGYFTTDFNQSSKLFHQEVGSYIQRVTHPVLGNTGLAYISFSFSPPVFKSPVV